MRTADRKAKRKALLRWWRAQFLSLFAYLWRPLLFRTTVIAITGSVGKTTCKEALAAVLSAHFPTANTLFNQNDLDGVPRTILRIRPWHRFAVVEVATDRPGLIGRSARLLRPDIAIVLAVARTHSNVFSTLEETAAEKAQLLETLPPEGLAILNADDARVQSMAAGCRSRVKTFGRRAGLDLWADDVSSKWPARLSLRVRTASETQSVSTKLVGEHWVSSVLAALLAAVSCGIPLQAAAGALGRLEPFLARMQPVLLPNGATILRDEANGSPDTLAAALRVLQESAALRRVLVVSDVSDSRRIPRARLRELGKKAFQAADLAVFIGEFGHHGTRGAIESGMNPDRVRSFADLQAAAAYLRSELRAGDFVLLKGRGNDHLSRVFFAQFGPIGCWKAKCSRRFVCDLCEELRPRFDLPPAPGAGYLYGSAASLSPSPKKLNASTMTKTGSTGSISHG